MTAADAQITCDGVSPSTCTCTSLSNEKHRPKTQSRKPKAESPKPFVPRDVIVYALPDSNSRIGLLNEKPLHAALKAWYAQPGDQFEVPLDGRSEEHTSELQSLRHLVCRLLLE